MISIKRYGGLNLDSLEVLGQGTQGKVYKIDTAKCIKVFKNSKACKDELETLVLAQYDKHFPKLYESGENYIVRECINGLELDKFLSIYPLNPLLSSKIIELYDSMFKVGFTRLDAAIFHIYVTPPYDLKLIDTAKALKKKAVCPSLILGGLDKLGYKNDFLSFVNSTRSDLYMKWKKHLK